MAPTREVRSRHVGIFKKLGRYASSDAELTEQEFQALVRMIAAKEYRAAMEHADEIERKGATFFGGKSCKDSNWSEVARQDPKDESSGSAGLTIRRPAKYEMLLDSSLALSSVHGAQESDNRVHAPDKHGSAKGPSLWPLDEDPFQIPGVPNECRRQLSCMSPIPESQGNPNARLPHAAMLPPARNSWQQSETGTYGMLHTQSGQNSSKSASMDAMHLPCKGWTERGPNVLPSQAGQLSQAGRPETWTRPASMHARLGRKRIGRRTHMTWPGANCADACQGHWRLGPEY